MRNFCKFSLKSFAYTEQIAGALAKEKVNENKKHQSQRKTDDYFRICRIGDSDGRN